MDSLTPVSPALIYAHWDRDGVVDPYVIHALSQYRGFVDRLVFVSTHCTRVWASSGGTWSPGRLGASWC